MCHASAIMRLPSSLLCLALSILPEVLAVFADEAYSVDYHHELLGIPLPQYTVFHRPRRDDKGTLLYTLSDLGILGAVNPSTGKIAWRQALSKFGNSTESGFMRPVEGESTIVTALGNGTSAWDARNGRAIWSNELAGCAMDLEVIESASATEEPKDVLVLYEDAGKGLLRRLKGAIGDVVWEYRDNSGDIPFQVSTNVMNVFLVSLHGTRGGYNLKVTILDPASGKKTSDYTLSTKADVRAPEDVLLVGANSAAPIVAWTDEDFKNLKVNLLGKSSEHSLPLKELYGGITKVTIHAPHLVQSQPHFLVHSQSESYTRADVYHIDLGSVSISQAYELPRYGGNGIIAVSCQDANVYFTRFTEDDVTVVSSASHGILGRWPLKLEKGHGQLVHGVSEVVHRGGNTYAVRSAAVTSDDDWILVRNGAEAWTRPESLSGAVTAQWAEIPDSESLVEALQAEAHSNPLQAYIHRVHRHVKDLQHLPAYLQALPKRFLSSVLPGDIVAPKDGVLVRDSFGLNKLVIVATKRGRVYALDAGHQGKIVWSKEIVETTKGKVFDVQGIWVDGVKGLVTIKGGAGDNTVLNITSGERLQDSSPESPIPVLGTAIVDSQMGKWLLPVGTDGNPGEISKNWAPTHPFIVRGSRGEIKGLRFEDGGSNMVPVTAWTFEPHGEQVFNVVARPSHDPVASIGRVLGDRSVLYKYLNPNAILVTAVSEKSSTASIYLVDTLSGEILHSAHHEGVDTSQPIASAISENWFAYSLWSDLQAGNDTLPSSKGYQLIISELYESSIPNDRGPLGDSSNTCSLAPSEIPNSEPALPHVITQSFIVPEQITHMSVTQTRQGITIRQLLCVLASNSIFGIPRPILDPRRPVGRDPTALEMEEGLFRYQPFIDVDPKLVLTHKREVIGIKDVITIAAVLESTSLVFAYGVDIFGTRVAPSAAFDILGKGFNKLSLVITVVALWVGVVILAPMVSLSSCFREGYANTATGEEETDQRQVDDMKDVRFCTHRIVL